MHSHGGGWVLALRGEERSRGRWDLAPAFGRVAAGVGPSCVDPWRERNIEALHGQSIRRTRS